MNIQGGIGIQAPVNKIRYGLVLPWLLWALPAPADSQSRAALRAERARVNVIERINVEIHQQLRSARKDGRTIPTRCLNDMLNQAGSTRRLARAQLATLDRTLTLQASASAEAAPVFAHRRKLGAHTLFLLEQHAQSLKTQASNCAQRGTWMTVRKLK